MVRRVIAPELIEQSIRALADAVGDPDVLARQIVTCTVNQALDNAEIVALAIASIRKLLPADNETRRWALTCLGASTSEYAIPPAAEMHQVVTPDAFLPEPPEPAAVLVDAEQMRILVALGYGPQTLVYAVAQQMTRDTTGRGAIDEHELLSTLTKYGVQSTYKNMRRWLTDGDGVLWRRHKNLLYLKSPARMSGRRRKGQLDVVQMALDAHRPELVITNHPGIKLISVPVAPMLTHWYGNLLAAWHNSRDEHTQGISRYTLEILWGKLKKTLIGWEKQAGIKSTASYAQYTDAEYVPAKHAFPVLVETLCDGQRTPVIRPMARWSNSYSAPTMKERQHKRAPRERARAARLVLEGATNSGIPNSVCGAAAASCSGVGFKPTGRRSFHSNDGTLKDAFKRLAHHLQRDPDDLAPHFVRLGFDLRRDCWLFEQNSTGQQQTTLDEQLPRSVTDKWFAQHGGRGAYVAAWREMSA